MFNKLVNALKTFFSAKPVSLQFEEMLLQEAVQEIKDAEATKEKVAAVSAKATVAKVEVATKTAAPKVKAAAKKVTKAVKADAPKVKAAAKKADKNVAKTAKKPNIKIVK
jgi:hypothetical protein